MLPDRAAKGTTISMTDKKQGHKASSRGAGDSKNFEKEPLPDRIGSSLRQLYDEVLSEDVPSEFLDLLRKADSSGSSPASK